MAIADPSWWGVWWPWLLVWGITVVSLVATVAIAVAHWRAHRAAAATRLHGIPIYLNDKYVMDLYRQRGGKDSAALSQEVQERTIRNRRFKWSAVFAWIGGRAESEVNSDVSRSYIAEAKPITVIDFVIDVLDRADDIVDVNLLKDEVTANRALDKALDTDDDERPTTVHLRDLNTFVWISGKFRETDDSTSAVRKFEARYGDPVGSTDGPQVHLTCGVGHDLRAAVPAGSFRAHCLGQVEDWDRNTRRLNVLPIAIFR